MTTLKQEAMSSSHGLRPQLITGVAIIFILALALLVTIFLLAAISVG
jgi:hypothetical protein